MCRHSSGPKFRWDTDVSSTNVGDERRQRVYSLDPVLLPLGSQVFHLSNVMTPGAHYSTLLWPGLSLSRVSYSETRSVTPSLTSILHSIGLRCLYIPITGTQVSLCTRLQTTGTQVSIRSLYNTGNLTRPTVPLKTVSLHRGFSPLERKLENNIYPDKHQ